VLIGLTGKAGAGKSTAGTYLAEAYGFELRSFAAPLKASAASLLGVDVSDLEMWKNEPGVTVEVWRDHPEGQMAIRRMTMRQFLQRYGTESHRDVFGSDFWVEQGMAGVYRESLRAPGTRIAWTDVRFPNEAEAIRAKGGIILRIDRHGAGAGAHISEQLDLAPDVIVENNKTIDAMRDTLDGVLEAYAIGPVGLGDVA
jgi:hypothetical protein